MAKVKWLWPVVFVVCQGLSGSYGRNTPKNDTNNETSEIGSGVSADNIDNVLINKARRLNPILNSGFISQTYTDFKRTADAYLTSVPKSQNDSREYLLNDARKIGYHLREIGNEELGVTAMQAAFDNSQFPPSSVEPSEDVRKISKMLQEKVERYLNILNKNRMAVESLYQHHLSNPLTEINQCCKMTSTNLKYDDHFGVPISKESTCDTVPLNIPNDAFLPGANLSKVFKQNLQDHPSIKWQYYISSEGVHSEFPAYNLETELGCKLETEARHRNIYFRTVQPYAKHVVIVIDHGNSMSQFQLSTAKTIGKYILSSLSHHDKVGLIGLAAEAQFPQSGGCQAQQMASVTYETKYQFSRFIDGLQKTSDGVNHLMGFKRAFEMIHNSPDFGPNSTNPNSEALIVYISRGLLSSIADAKVIMESIARENHRMSNRVVINTYTILEEGKPVTFEKTFLQDVAEQNYKQYHINNIPNEMKTKPGVMVAVNSSENLGYMIGNFLSVLSSDTNPGVAHYSLPHWDTIGKGLVISITRSVYFGDRLLGVVGLDISVADLADGVTYYGQLPHSYAFLMEESGVAIMHPSFPRPAYSSGQPMHTDIWHLEQRGDTRRIKRDIMKQTYGEERVPTNSSNTPLWRYGFDIESEESVSLQYNWHRVDGTPYTVCIVTSKRKDHKRGKLGKGSPRPAVFTYHRLDLIPPATPVKLCKHLKQLSTTDVSTVFLSAATFETPFDYLLKDETPEMADRLLSYLHDMTGTITNPGLKESVRRDVLMVAIITDHWKKKLDNEFSKYIVRKYVATQGGVFLTYPGTVIDKTYDPTKREWFTRALEFPGRVIVSAPYLDVGGAGYIVTVSSVILEGKYASMHSTSDPIVAVMGMDLTLGYFYKLVTEVISICQEDRVACFLLDDRGYLISHPSFIEPNSNSAEQQHITHKEPLVAGDILNHKYFAEKKLCNSFSDRTIQRFYQFNTSSPFLTNLVQGESCAKYTMTPVPGTNIFVGIVNQTCDVITTFCPCSTTDRLCLNCHRMEQTECECPCECPLEMNLCTGQLMDENDNNPSCPRFPEEPHAPVIGVKVMENLDLCFESKCYTRKTKNDCFGVLGCEWCQLELNGNGFTSLKKEFCTEQRKCFGGVLGGRTPYADEIIGLPSDDYLSSLNSTPVGPVAGGIISCFLVFAFAVYCYRSHINRNGSTEYITSPPDGNMHISQMDNEVDDPDINEDRIYRAPCSNIVLASFDNAAVVSPYRFATGYRRRTGGDSDPGYSTMTPHDDSENIPYVEPLLLGKDRQKAPASQLSVSSCSRASSPYNPSATTPPEMGGITNFTSVLTPIRSCNSPVVTNVPHHWGQIFANNRDLTQTIIPEVQVHAQVHMADTR